MAGPRTVAELTERLDEMRRQRDGWREAARAQFDRAERLQAALMCACGHRRDSHAPAAGDCIGCAGPRCDDDELTWPGMSGRGPIRRTSDAAGGGR